MSKTIKKPSSTGAHVKGAHAIDNQTEAFVPSKAAIKAQEKAAKEQAKYEEKAYKEREKEARKAEKEAAKYAPPAFSQTDDIGEVLAKRDKSRKALRVLATVLGIIIGLIIVAYLVGAIIFSGRFFPNTVIGNSDISMMTIEETQETLENEYADYSLHVTGYGLDLTLGAADAGVDFDCAAIAKNAHEDVNIWLWPVEVFNSHDETGKLVATSSDDSMLQKVTDAVNAVNATAIAPVNANVSYNESSKVFEITKEIQGTQLSVEAVVTAIEGAIANLDRTLVLDSSALIVPNRMSTDPVLATARDTANNYLKTNYTLTFNGATVTTVNADVLHSWIRFGDDMSVSVSEDDLVNWSTQLRDNTTTVGSTRTYTRPDGKSITVTGGSYGWVVDADTLTNMVRDAVYSISQASAELPYSQSAAQWLGFGLQDWGARYIDVDKSEQHVRMYDESGALIWETDCVTGKPTASTETPCGVWMINYKESPSTLIGTNADGSKYESQVTYWMPFDGSLIGLHDASWQSAFGGTRYMDGYGSHGCVNLPTDAAATLYSIAKTGDVVVVHE